MSTSRTRRKRFESFIYNHRSLQWSHPSITGWTVCSTLLPKPVLRWCTAFHDPPLSIKISGNHSLRRSVFLSFFSALRPFIQMMQKGSAMWRGLSVMTMLLLAQWDVGCWGMTLNSVPLRPGSQRPIMANVGAPLHRHKRNWVWNQFFVLEEYTGDDPLYVGKNLDFETKSTYTLKIEASNRNIDPQFLSQGPFSDTAMVRVTVENVDEPPIFYSPLSKMVVSEAAKVGTIIGTVSAVDPDSTNSPIRYSIDRNTDLERFFNIEAATGVIITAKPLDREANAVHNITILAIESLDPSQVGKGVALITVMDINDNAPVFAIEYETFLCESAGPGQVIETISAVDKDEPLSGHRFFFSFTAETVGNMNFTLRDNKDNTASILTKRSGFQRREQAMYRLPVLIVDSGTPALSSTNTLSIRVCDCDSVGTPQSCGTEAFMLSAGLSTGALIAILACIITLLVLVLLIVTMRRRKKEPLILDEDRDVRENIVRYDDEGGGEEDTEAFDMVALRNLNVGRDSKVRRDVTPELPTLYCSRPPPYKITPDNGIFREFIWDRLKDADIDLSAPPYDSLQTYAFEGSGSMAESLSSLDSLSTDSEQNYDYLSDWGPRFRKLADLYGHGDSSNIFS
ncbi:cadherin-7-like isoform X2 [Xyrauchen texanus]|uniref:cadherin-7-like isoform X2 n=1 Tax=Xyrauchen texanus TaxID=154827 RepID=UPI0022426015|nr:cadherin-7-like isoform X2 [Xyrauchen texanus]